MALTSLTDLQTYERNLELLAGDRNGLYDLIKELQGLRVSVVAGADDDVNIAVTGIATEDTLLSVLQVEPDNGSGGTMLTDRTGESSITSAGNIQLTTTDTTGKQLLVIWYNKS